MIEEYRFGSIIIDGKTYTNDVEVRDGEVLEWQRKEGHVIDEEDVKRAVEQSPDTIVIGTGETGGAQITENAKSFIESYEIKLITDMTEQATKTFNIINDDSEEEEGEQESVIGLFHITC
ncbi:MTH938/NDUFAF3 family protein [Patescibacteria group bacterium]